MTTDYAIHADAISELSFEDIGELGMHLLTSQCRWNEMRCEDRRNEAALISFIEQAEVSSQKSGIFGPFHNQNFDHFFHHFCLKRWQIILLANNALMKDHNQAVSSNVLSLRSDHNNLLKNKGIKPASLKILMHNSGTAFAGLAALQMAIADYLNKVADKGLRQQQVKTVVDQLCKSSINLSVIDLSELSKSSRKLLKLGILQTKGYGVIKIQDDVVTVIELNQQRQDAVMFCMNYMLQSPFFMPQLHISQHKNVDNNRQWQAFHQAIAHKNIACKQTLPSVGAMLSFGKSICSFGWIELNK